MDTASRRDKSPSLTEWEERRKDDGYYGGLRSARRFCNCYLCSANRYDTWFDVEWQCPSGAVKVFRLTHVGILNDIFLKTLLHRNPCIVPLMED